jgi:hypothetical protein
MSLQEDFKKKNKQINVKALFDILMGIIYAGVGGVLLASDFIGLDITFPPPEAVKIFGAAAFIYGCFRIFRGIKTYNIVQ